MRETLWVPVVAVLGPLIGSAVGVLLENRGMRVFFVAIPYVVSLLPAALTLCSSWYAFRFKEIGRAHV